MFFIICGCAEADYLDPNASDADGRQTSPNMIQNDGRTVDIPSGECAGLAVDTPEEGSTVRKGRVEIRGSILHLDRVDLTVGGQNVQSEGGNFGLVLDLPDGDHIIDIRCGTHSLNRGFRVQTGEPRFVIETPQSGVIIDANQGPIEVAGRLENSTGIQGISLNGDSVPLQADGRFRATIQPMAGINHLDFEAIGPDDERVDMRRSFLFGALTQWSASLRDSVLVDIRQSALDEIARAVERRLTDDELEEMLDDHMGRRGDLELHEIKYDRMELDLEPKNGRLRVRLELHDFGLKFTYHYRVIGIGGRIRGWARCDPAIVEADVHISQTANGGFTLRVDNPEVRLRDFDLDLNDFYSIVEGLIQPMVRDIGRDAMVTAMRDLVFKDLIQAEILNQELDLFGQTTRLKVHIDQLDIDEQGIGGTASASIEPFPVVHDVQGFWAGDLRSNPGHTVDDMSLALNVSLLNRMIAEAWRGGLLDVDLASILGDDDALSTALLLGPAGPQMAEHIPPTSTVRLQTVARMQPTAHIDDPATGRVAIRAGALQVSLSSENHQGQWVEWAVAELSFDLTVTPIYVDGQFQVQADLKSRIEIVDAPIFPLDETGLEAFLEAIIAGMTGPMLDDAVNQMFEFGDLDILGMSVGNVNFSGQMGQEGYMYLGLDLTSR